MALATPYPAPLNRLNIYFTVGAALEVTDEWPWLMARSRPPSRFAPTPGAPPRTRGPNHTTEGRLVNTPATYIAGPSEGVAVTAILCALMLVVSVTAMREHNAPQ